MRIDRCLHAYLAKSPKIEQCQSDHLKCVMINQKPQDDWTHANLNPIDGLMAQRHYGELAYLLVGL